MKRIAPALILLLGAAAFTASLQAQQPAKSAAATYITEADVQATLNRSPEAAVNPQPKIRVVDTGGYNVAVGALHRPQKTPGAAAVHFNVTEIYHVIDGPGTHVTVGTMVNDKTRQHSRTSLQL